MSTRGLRTIRAAQIAPTELRDSNFDSANPIDENKVAIQWANHTEILQNKKIDVFVQVNNKSIAGVSALDVSTDVGVRPVSTDGNTEGVVLPDKVIIRKNGTPDTPVADAQGNPVYGKLTESSGSYTLSFYSMVGSTETEYTGGAGEAIDFKFAVRTNLFNIPVDALINSGSGFVEGATDAKAYNNILQLVKDVYGNSGHADNDGNANLTDEGYGASLYDRIQNFIAALAATTNNNGAHLIGVVPNAQYTGATVQDVLNNLAARIAANTAEITTARDRSASANGYFTADTFSSVDARLEDSEDKTDAALKSLSDRAAALESQEPDEVVVEADGSGTQTSFALPSPAKVKSVRVYHNGIMQAPELNYDRILNGAGNCTSVTIPTALGIAKHGIPDSLYITYDKA
jgi:hypothetical protein